MVYNGFIYIAGLAEGTSSTLSFHYLFSSDYACDAEAVRGFRSLMSSVP